MALKKREKKINILLKNIGYATCDADDKDKQFIWHCYD